MATRTGALRGTASTTGYAALPTKAVYTQTFEFDIAKDITANGAIASADIINLIPIPDNTLLYVNGVINGSALVLGTSGVVELGDNSDDDRFVANQTTTTAGAAATIEAVGQTGYTYTAADTLSLKLSNSGGTITSGKLWITVTMIDLNAVADGKPSF